MDHTEITALVKEFMRETAVRDSSGPDSRVRAIVFRLLTDLFKAIEELDMTPSEVWAGLDYLQECGQKGEVALLAAGLGVERFLDIRLDEAEAGAGIRGGTPRAIEGPLYVWGAPECEGFAILDDGRDHHRAEILFMQGKVASTDGRTLPKARVAVWHANPDGGYSCFDASQTPFNLRRVIITDEKGEYGFRSVVPAGYACPQDGPTQKLLGLLGRHGQRPACIHFAVSAPDHRSLTTQIVIDGDEYLWRDFAFAERYELLPKVRRVTGAEAMEKAGLDKPFALIEFDFTLVPDKPGVPGYTVQRKRAEA